MYLKFNENLVKTSQYKTSCEATSYISKQTRVLFTRIVEAFFKNYGKIPVGIPVGKAVNLQN